MHKTVFLFISFITFSPIVLFSQPYQERKLLIKSKVLEIKEYHIQRDFKTLSAIYYINDSGLIEKSILLRFDSIVAVNPNLDSLVYDTTSMTIFRYDSLNRNIEQYSTSDNEQITIKREYINKNTTKEIKTGGKYNSTTEEKLFKRNNLSIYKTYKNNELYQTTRIRKYNHKIVYRITHKKESVFFPHKVKYISILDNKKRRVKEYSTYKRVSPKKRSRTVSIYSYNEELLEKECHINPTIIERCYIYEYKTGIKLKEQ